MKTKLTLLLTLLFSVGLAFAQEDGFFYVNEIEGNVIYPTDLPSTDWYKQLDFDGDGVYDVTFGWNQYKKIHLSAGSIYDWWMYTYCYSWKEGDTIASTNSSSYWCPPQQTPGEDPDITFPAGFSRDSLYAAFRKPVGDSSYVYAWVRFSIDAGELINCDWPNSVCIIHDYAFCNISDYPLRIGQTSLNWNVGEASLAPFVIYPNPTDGVVRVKGKGFATAELFSMAGQRMAVKTIPVEDGLSIDIGGLPAGVYFVSITDTDGRKSVHKVVRE